MTQNTDSTPARYIMIGGFLGAGKTTAVAQLAEVLSKKGLRVGLITNDQGGGLVDTAMLRSRGFETEEIAGGCFCCRFNSLVDAADKLTATSRPEVFIAEPVGSCTDLVATVTYPLRRMYGDSFTIAPLSVLVDPHRAMRVLGCSEGRSFSEKVVYIYRKQLEEADLVLINKCDLLSADETAMLKEAIVREYPDSRVILVSARTGEGLEKWFDILQSEEQVARRVMNVDYETYAAGEALLGWLNCTVEIFADEEFDMNDTLKQLADSIQAQLSRSDNEIAHLKMTFSADDGINDVAVINLVRNDYVPELSQKLQDPAKNGQLIVNLRAEAEPEILNSAVESALHELNQRNQTGAIARLEHMEHFKPGKPQPTHRITSPV